MDPRQVGAKGEERNLTEEPQCASAAQPNNQGCACLAELRCVEIQASACAGAAFPVLHDQAVGERCALLLLEGFEAVAPVAAGERRTGQQHSGESGRQNTARGRQTTALTALTARAAGCQGFWDASVRSIHLAQPLPAARGIEQAVRLFGLIS
jgi:hypothetical protein